MKKIENQTFVNAYLKCWVNAFSNPEMARAWHGAHNWTVEHMNNVLYPLAKTLGYCDKSCEHCGGTTDGIGKCKPSCQIYGINLQQEYYKVDFSLYDSKYDDGWTLDYAIEHENAAFELNTDQTVKYSGWFNEFMKLLPLNCANARVIIGYDEFLCENGQDKFDAKLAKCMSRLESDAVAGSLALKPIILIVFPYTKAMKKIVDGFGRKQTELLRAVEFVYEKDKWIKRDIPIANAEQICDAYRKIVAEK